MEVVGGLMTMFSMVFFFLAVIWFITPFVIFAIKGKVDRTHQLVEQLERRIADLERRIPAPGNEHVLHATINPPSASDGAEPSAPTADHS
jgi:hypothetical protein